VLSPERQGDRMSKIKNDGLDQCGADPFEQQQFGTAGVKWVRHVACFYYYESFVASVIHVAIGCLPLSFLPTLVCNLGYR